jgi:hypothetical protein
MKIHSTFWQNVREIILAATAFWCCNEARAVYWTVISSADNNGPNTYTLRDVINNHAVAGDIITFGFPSSTTITLNPLLGNQGELAINFNLTISNGLGATNLSIVNTGGRVFHVAVGNITFAVSGLTMTGQYTAPAGADGTALSHNGSSGTAAFGGGIFDESSQLLSVSNCIMVNCMAVGGKGGNAYVPITEGARAEGNGGDGGYGSGGAISHEHGDLYIYGSTFMTNIASGGKGGKGHDGGTGGNGGQAGKGLLDSGGGGGGAVEVEYDSAQFSMINSTFLQNIANGGQGGQGGDGWILGSGATANGGAGGMGGNASGGAIYIVAGCIACQNMNCRGLDSCTVVVNTCNPGSGGSGGASGGSGGSAGATGSSGTSYGGGLWFANVGCLKLANTIIADNFPNSSFAVVGPDIDAVVDSLGWNLIGNATGSSGWPSASTSTDLLGMVGPNGYMEPYIGPLSFNNGGPTPTLLPTVCSPALDAGANVWHNPTDQNGQPRTVPIRPFYNSSDGTDIGAVELQSFPAAPALTITQTPAEIIIGWTLTNGPCYELQQTSDLSSGPWVVSPNQVQSGNNQYNVFIPLPVTGDMFYRLWYPY